MLLGLSSEVMLFRRVKTAKERRKAPKNCKNFHFLGFGRKGRGSKIFSPRFRSHRYVKFLNKTLLDANRREIQERTDSTPNGPSKLEIEIVVVVGERHDMAEAKKAFQIETGL